jgi:glyoxylase-like metal-dependent hydrolase (beta-lactamase superfamily II)
VDVHIFSEAVPPFFKNGYVVSCEDTKEGVFIDPGDEAETLVAEALAARVNVTAILLTHAHIDHITGVGRVKKTFDVPIWLHREDLFFYDGIVEQARMFGLHAERQPDVTNFYDAGERLRFGNYDVEVSHTPGHAPGGVCLAIGRRGENERALFVGDTLFAGSIGRTDLPGGDYGTLIAAIRDVLFAFPDESLVYPGHGPQTTIGAERRTNPFLT